MSRIVPAGTPQMVALSIIGSMQGHCTISCRDAKRSWINKYTQVTGCFKEVSSYLLEKTAENFCLQLIMRLAH